MLPVNRHSARFQANVRAWFAHHGFPEPGIFGLQEDRCCFEWMPDLAAKIAASVGTLLDPWTRAISAHQPLGYRTAIDGWRERVGTYAVQLILHDDHFGRRFYEIDWDPRNPNWGLAPLIGHGVDWLRWKIRGWKVNPFAVEKVLRKRGVILGAEGGTEA